MYISWEKFNDYQENFYTDINDLESNMYILLIDIGTSQDWIGIKSGRIKTKRDKNRWRSGVAG